MWHRKSSKNAANNTKERKSHQKRWLFLLYAILEIENQRGNMNLSPTLRKLFRRSNEYYGEYAGMLLSATIAMVATVVVVLEYIQWIAYAVTPMLSVTFVTAASLMTVAGAVAVWLYARVSGEELVNAKVRRSSTRKVLRSLWVALLIPVGAYVLATVYGGILQATYTGGQDYLRAIVTLVASFVATSTILLTSIYAILRQSTRENAIKTVVCVSTVLASLSIVALVASLLAFRSGAMYSDPRDAQNFPTERKPVER